jgi:hypothetical protein
MELPTEAMMNEMAELALNKFNEMFPDDSGLVQAMIDGGAFDEASLPRYVVQLAVFAFSPREGDEAVRKAAHAIKLIVSMCQTHQALAARGFKAALGEVSEELRPFTNN